MSQPSENVLYIGHNVQLAKTMLNLFAPVSASSNYCLHHLNRVEHIQSALAEREYSHFICELSFSDSLADKIATDFPLLKTTYLRPPDTSKSTELSMVMEGLVTDEVKATLDYLSIPIYFKNLTGQFLACNSYFSHLFGLTPTQVIGKTAAEVLSPHLVEGIEELDEKIFSEQQVYFYECKIADPGGRERDVVFRKESVANGKIQIGMIFDVTEINEAKSLLEKERIMLRATADMSPDFIFFKDLESRYLGCNKAYADFLGFPAEEIVGKKDDQLYERKQALLYQAQDKELISKNKTYFADEYLINKKGVRHFIDIRKVPLKDSQGKAQCLIGVAHDITAHHQMQKQLKIADSVFQNAKECLLVTDQQGNIISANKALCTASGYLESELLNADVTLFASNQHENIEAALQEKSGWQGELSYIRKNGKVNFAWLEVYIVEHAEKGIFSRIYSFVDLSQSQAAEEKVQFLAKSDPLTGLFNRVALFSRLEDAFTRAKHKQTAMAALLVNINGFKEINDNYGHNAGDAVLKEVAGRLKSCVFEKDTVARLGDDEFVIIIDELVNEQDGALLAKKIVKQFNKKFTIQDDEVNLSAAMGIAICPDDGEDADSLIGNAEKAMQRGKAANSPVMDNDSLQARLKKSCHGSVYHFYTRKLTHHSRLQVKLENELKQALQQGQFELYYQPQYDLNKRQTVALEGVLRWNHPQRGIQEAESFLSLAENNGLLIDIGLQMLRKAATQAVTWQNSGINFGRIAIKLSLKQLQQISFIADLQTILLETKCASRWLEFEVDELIFRSDSPVVYENLVNIAKVGVALTVANFSEGRPILYLFEQLRIEKFKMSKSYTEMQPGHFVGSAMKDAVFTLASSLGLDVVGESLGSREDDTFSNTNKLDAGRGLLGKKAMKASEATFYLRCHKRK